MRIRLLAFASATDVLGAGEFELSLPEGARIAELKTELNRKHPKLEDLWTRLAIAVDGELASEETALREGAEVALLPPVSGGVERSPYVALVEEPIDVPHLLARVTSAASGAVVLFVGTVRNRHAGRAVTKITYTAYRPMAKNVLRRIAADLETAETGLRVAIVHRLGEIPSGEASVAIVVSSPHRAPAYEASRRALERIKAEAPIWKRELYASGEVMWREEEPLTHSARSTAEPWNGSNGSSIRTEKTRG